MAPIKRDLTKYLHKVYRPVPSGRQYRVVAEVWEGSIERYHPTQGWRACPEGVSELPVLEGLESRLDARLISNYLNAREREARL